MVKVGTIINFKAYDHIYGKIIRVYNRIVYKEDGYTHTGIVTDVKDDAIEIAEAINKGFTISWYDKKWVEDKIKEGTITTGEAIKPLKNVREIAKKYEGTRYGWRDILSIFTIILWRKRAIGFTGTKSIICSEAVARILYDASDKKIDFEPEFKKSYDLITPTDLSKSKQIKW